MVQSAGTISRPAWRLPVLTWTVIGLLIFHRYLPHPPYLKAQSTDAENIYIIVPIKHHIILVHKH